MAYVKGYKIISDDIEYIKNLQNSLNFYNPCTFAIVNTDIWTETTANGGVLSMSEAGSFACMKTLCPNAANAKSCANTTNFKTSAGEGSITVSADIYITSFADNKGDKRIALNAAADGTTSVDVLGFQIARQGAAYLIWLNSRKNSASTMTAGDAITSLLNTWITLSFTTNTDWTSVSWSINGTEQTAVTTNIPDDVALYFGFTNPANSAGGDEFYYIKNIQVVKN